jgi:hypothetical protein
VKLTTSASSAESTISLNTAVVESYARAKTEVITQQQYIFALQQQLQMQQAVLQTQQQQLHREAEERIFRQQQDQQEMQDQAIPQQQYAQQVAFQQSFGVLGALQPVPSPLHPEQALHHQHHLPPPLQSLLKHMYPVAHGQMQPTDALEQATDAAPAGSAGRYHAGSGPTLIPIAGAAPFADPNFAAPQNTYMSGAHSASTFGQVTAAGQGPTVAPPVHVSPRALLVNAQQRTPFAAARGLAVATGPQFAVPAPQFFGAVAPDAAGRYYTATQTGQRDQGHPQPPLPYGEPQADNAAQDGSAQGGWRSRGARRKRAGADVSV